MEPSSKTEMDEYGHGTFMARLVMQMVPGCELYIARVTQTTQQLENNDERVAKVSDIYSIQTPCALLSRVNRL